MAARALPAQLLQIPRSLPSAIITLMSSDTAVPDPATTTRLVTLRLLLTQATTAASDHTVAGRHAAIILLDGACEIAMGIALDQYGDTSQNFDGMFSRLHDRLASGWSCEGWAGVRIMHRARNSAQHHGIAPDREQLQIWTADADRFVRGLVFAVFGHDLRSTSLSTAVNSDAIRERLARAEEALGLGNAAELLAASRSAFDLARESWRAERAFVAPSAPRLNPFDELTSPAVRSQLEQLNDTLEVQPFALDLGEYLWFKSLPQTQPDGPQPTLDQSSRALSFVFSWVVRWEAFSARYDATSLYSWSHDLRPPRSTTAELGTRITSVSVSPIEVRVAGTPTTRIRVVLQLVDAPEDDFEGWFRDVQHGLYQYPRDTYEFASITRVGRITVDLVTTGVDTARLRDWIASVLGAAETARAERARKHASWADDYAHLLPPFQDALLRLTDQAGRPIFCDVRLIPSSPPDPSRDPPDPKIWATFADPQCVAESDVEFANEMRNRIGLQLGGGSWAGKPGVSFPTTKDPAELAETVTVAYLRAEERKSAREKAVSLQSQSAKELASRLRAAFALDD